MKKWIEKILSNKYIRVAAVCLVIMSLIAFFEYIFLLSVKSGMPVNSLSVLADIFVILITILVIIIMISVTIMIVRMVIYGKEVKHDKTYWKVNKETHVIETENNPYLLPVRYSNPIMPFVIGFGCYVIVPCLICLNYLHFDFSQLRYIFFLILIEYVLIVAIVISIRLFRRIRAFQVKLTERI